MQLPPSATRTDTLFPYTTLVRSCPAAGETLRRRPGTRTAGAGPGGQLHGACGLAVADALAPPSPLQGGACPQPARGKTIRIGQVRCWNGWRRSATITGIPPLFAADGSQRERTTCLRVGMMSVRSEEHASKLTSLMHTS